MAEQKEQKVYTYEEVKQLSDNKRYIVVIHNNVYDVAEFLNEHPGGEEVLIEQAGRDATEAFEDVGHSSDSREMMVKYQIGVLAESDRKKEEVKETKNWNSNSTGDSDSASSWKSWVIPIILGLIGTYILKFFLLRQ